MNIKVAKILPFTAVDGIGNRTIIFFQGCNFNCKYCHNPETIPMDFVEESTLGKEMTIEEILKYVSKYRDFTRGVTISGGECTLHFSQLYGLVKALKEENYNILIDTNGYLDFENLKRIEPLCDGFMLDLKSYSKEEHILLTGKDNEKVIKNFEFLAERKKIYEVRTVIVENYLNNFENVDEISKMISKHDENIRYKLIKYRPHGVRKSKTIMKVPSDKLMEELKEKAKNNGLRNIFLI